MLPARRPYRKVCEGGFLYLALHSTNLKGPQGDNSLECQPTHKSESHRWETCRQDVGKSSHISVTGEKLLRARQAGAYVLMYLAKFGLSSRESTGASSRRRLRTVFRCLSELEEEGSSNGRVSRLPQHRQGRASSIGRPVPDTSDHQKYHFIVK